MFHVFNAYYFRMEARTNCLYIAHEIDELEVLKLSRQAILPTKAGRGSYWLYSPYTCTVLAGYSKIVSTDLTVSTTNPLV